MMNVEAIKRTHENDRKIFNLPLPSPEVARLMFRVAFEHREALLAEVERLEADAAALREALEEIQKEAETDLDRDIILTACWSALAADAGRALLKRLRTAERREAT